MAVLRHNNKVSKPITTEGTKSNSFQYCAEVKEEESTLKKYDDSWKQQQTNERKTAFGWTMLCLG